MRKYVAVLIAQGLRTVLNVRHVGLGAHAPPRSITRLCIWILNTMLGRPISTFCLDFTTAGTVLSAFPRKNLTDTIMTTWYGTAPVECTAQLKMPTESFTSLCGKAKGSLASY